MLLLSVLSLSAAAQALPDSTARPYAARPMHQPDLELSETEEASETLGELLHTLSEHPVDANTAPAEELARIPALSLLVAQEIVRHRDRQGPFHTLADLEAVRGVGPALLQRIQPYLTLTEAGTAEAPQRRAHVLFDGLTSEVVLRTGRSLRPDARRGQVPAEGRAESPDRLYGRVRVRSRGGLRLNLTLEKDPGEALRWAPATHTYGFGFASAHVALLQAGRIEALVVGDFTAEFGQGVVLWRGSAFGKGRETVGPLVRRGGGLVPYGSTEEERFFRGVGTTVRLLPGVSCTAFTSFRPGGEAPSPPGADTSGSAAPRALSGEKVLGGAVHYRRGRLRAGLVGYRSRVGGLAALPGEEDASGPPAAAPGPDGTVSAFADLLLGAVHLFGEAARDQGGRLGGIGGLQLRLGAHGDAVLLARHFPGAFESPHGYAFGERTGATRNESGLYTGLRLRLAPPWMLAAFFDQYTFPWARFGVHRPSTGREALLLLQYDPRRWLSVYLQARSETKEGGTTIRDPSGRLLRAVRPETRESVRLHATYLFGPRLRLRLRAEASRSFVPALPAAAGLLLYQDLRLLLRPNLQVDLRLAFFDADHYDARIYAYEDDLRYTFVVPAHTGRGQRAYVLVGFLPTAKLHLQLKLALTQTEDRTADRLHREIKAQLRWRL